MVSSRKFLFTYFKAVKRELHDEVFYVEDINRNTQTSIETILI